MHYQSISLKLWPLGERLISLLLSTLICVFSCVALFFESAIVGQLTFAAIAMASASTIREDAAYSLDAIKQWVLPNETNHVS